MTKRRLVACVATFLVLSMGLMPVPGKASECPAMTPVASASSTTPAPILTGPAETAEPFGGDLFTPAPAPKCQAGACWGNGTPCGENNEGICSQPKGAGCGICILA